MTQELDIDTCMDRFRLAGRELFNSYFRLPDPYANQSGGWELEERFGHVENALFESLVLAPASLPHVPYGQLQPGILVELRRAQFAPIMINRDVSSGYWDHPITQITSDAKLAFVRFFDWDQLGCRDNQYVQARIEEWPAHPESKGKLALVEAQYVRFIRRP